MNENMILARLEGVASRFEEVGRSIKNFFAVRVREEGRSEDMSRAAVKKVKQAYQFPIPPAIKK